MSVTMKVELPWANSTVASVARDLSFAGLCKYLKSVYPDFGRKGLIVSVLHSNGTETIVSNDAGLASAIAEARAERRTLSIRGLFATASAVPATSSSSNTGSAPADEHRSVRELTVEFAKAINPILKRRATAWLGSENVVKDDEPAHKPKPSVANCLFIQNLKALEEMGFTNRDTNIETLVLYRADLLQTVRHLVNRAQVVNAIGTH